MSHFDRPGIDPASIELTVQQNVLAVKAERPPIAADGLEMIVSERPVGTFTRQLFLGETLDADQIEADYNPRVVTLTVPVAEAAEARRLEITTHGDNSSAPPELPRPAGAFLAAGAVRRTSSNSRPGRVYFWAFSSPQTRSVLLQG
jgi:HSP20 family protein